MHYHTAHRFPSAEPDIEALASRDKSFATLLADYEEINTWLAVQDRSAKPDSNEIANALELIGELEKEIQQQLEDYNEHTR